MSGSAPQQFIVEPRDPGEPPFGACSLAALLAPASACPPQLRTLGSIMQAARQPMLVAWGASLRLIYNDAYALILGERHPAAFGQPMLLVWAEAAEALAPLIVRTLAGESIYMNDIQLLLVRGGDAQGVPQEAHFSFSFTPIAGPQAGEVLGIFCVCAETTSAVMQAKLLTAEETRRRELFLNAPGFIAVLDGPQHVFEFANHAFSFLAGARTLLGRSVREALPELVQQGLIDRLDQVYATGQRYLARGLPLALRPHPSAPITTRYLDFVYEPITDSAQRVTGIFIEGFDTTDTVLAQRQAKEIDTRRRQVLDAMAEGFIMLDESFRLLEINAEGLRLDGRPIQHLLGQTHWALWPASVGTQIETHYRRVMAERKPTQFQHRYVSETHDICLDVRVYPVRGGIASFCRDVSVLAAANTALQLSHDRFRAAMQAVGVMWTNNAEGRMTGPQPGWARLTGQSEAAYTGFGWADALHPDDAQATVAAWNEAVAARHTFAFEHRVRRRDGVWRRFSVRAVPVMEASGALREWVGVHIDITEATADADALRAADRRKDEFLATLAHELRNPLTPIRHAALLLANPRLPPERLTWLAGVIARQSQTMAQLLEELLDLSRFRSGSIALNPEPTELAQLVDAAVETVQQALDTKQHRLVVTLPAEPVLLHVDRLRTTQVLINLLTNAVKYTDPGGLLRIHATLHPDADSEHRLCLEVSDNGIGLAPESLAEIFDMFTQVRGSRDRADGGLGIGLTLTKRLVELQGGHIEATSPGLGQGSTFRVSFPLPDARPPA